MSDFETRFYDLQHRTKNDTLSLKWMNEYALREISDKRLRYFLMANVLRSEASQALHDLLIMNNELKSTRVEPALTEVVERFKNTLAMHNIELSLTTTVKGELQIKSKMLFYLCTVVAELTTMLVFSGNEAEISAQLSIDIDEENDSVIFHFSSDESPVLPELTMGFGDHLLNLMLTRQMRGSYEFHIDERFSLQAKLPIQHLSLS